LLAVLTDVDPRVVGRYRLQGRLGAGGMGAVYLGFDPAGRPAAVKVIRPELGDDPEFQVRFRREVAAARRVTGRGVAEVLDADVTAAAPWLATEYVDGLSLSAAVARRGRIDDRTLTTLAAGLAEGLVAVHAAGLVHRDLKPANVLLSWEGPKIIDFGIAYARDVAGPSGTGYTGTGNVIGTMAWMAPEQLRGEPVGPAADIFAWGMCVAFAARGRHPFPADTVAASAMRVLRDPPDLAGVPESLLPIVGSALGQDAATRPSAVELVAALVGRPVSGASDASRAAGDLLAGWVQPDSTPRTVPPATTGEATAPPDLAPPDLAPPDLAPPDLPLPELSLPGAVEPPEPSQPAEEAAIGPTTLRRAVTSEAAANPRRRLRAGILAAAAVVAVGVVVALATVLSGGSSAHRRGPSTVVGLAADGARPAVSSGHPADPGHNAPGPGASPGDGAPSAGTPPSGGAPAAGRSPGAGSVGRPAAGSSAGAPTTQATGVPAASTPARAAAPLPRATTAGRALGAGKAFTVISGSKAAVPTYNGPATLAVFGGRRSSVATGGAVTLYCAVYGQAVTGRGATSRLWDYTNKGWINDVYVHTGTTSAVVPACAGTITQPRLGGVPKKVNGPFAVVASGSTLPVRAVAGSGATVIAQLRTGDLVTLSCFVTSSTVKPPSGLTTASNEWDKIRGGGWVPDADVYTDTATSTAPAC
jgi:eukaryotic-like serine/threonine-protein kinase